VCACAPVPAFVFCLWVGVGGLLYLYTYLYACGCGCGCVCVCTCVYVHSDYTKNLPLLLLPQLHPPTQTNHLHSRPLPQLLPEPHQNHPPTYPPPPPPSGVWRFFYYGHIRNLIGAEAWTKLLLQEDLKIPNVKEVRFETNYVRDYPDDWN
jgi:hypothetical protein